jgi:hypothetical protein
MKIGSGIVIGKDDAAGASAVRKPPEDRRDYQAALTLVTTEISNASIVQPGYVVSGLQP